MKLKLLLSICGTASIILVSTLPAWAQGQVIFTLNNKAITGVPIDQLGMVKYQVTSGKQTFKQALSKYWQNPGILGSGLVLSPKKVAHQSPDDYTGSGDWDNRYYFADNQEDSSWPDSKTINGNLKAGALALKLWEVSTGEDLIFAVHYSKQKKTGKQIWQNGGWVDETYWDRVGEPLAKGRLAFLPPTPSNQLPDWTKLEQISLNYLNTDNSFRQIRGGKQADFTAATHYSYVMAEKEAMVKTPEDGLMDFNGAGFKMLKAVSGPVYSWNFLEKSTKEMIYAEYTVETDLHVKRTANVFMNTEFDTHCSNAKLIFKKMLDEAAWTVSYFNIPDDGATSCKKK